MSDIKDGGPAFPLANSHVDLAGTNWEHANGLTLRDYFAAKVMASLTTMDSGTWESDAKSAYLAADAMLRARGQS